LVIFVEVCVLFELAERLGDVSGDRRLFRDDENFSHLSGESLSCATALAQLIFYFKKRISTTACRAEAWRRRDMHTDFGAKKE
jgi:hypothetical protein